MLAEHRLRCLDVATFPFIDSVNWDILMYLVHGLVEELFDHFRRVCNKSHVLILKCQTFALLSHVVTASAHLCHTLAHLLADELGAWYFCGVASSKLLHPQFVTIQGYGSVTYVCDLVRDRVAMS